MTYEKKKVDEEKASFSQKVVDDYVLNFPRSLTTEEKKYLLAVERGDMANVRRVLQAAQKVNNKSIDVNCVDSFGRGAFTLAIELENLEMIKLLIVMGVETKDALLQAISQEFVEAVELLLEYEELLNCNEVQNDGQHIIHSWQKVEPTLARYLPEITPLMIAAQRNNYEILKILLERGATLPMPHDIRCGCEECLRLTTGDSLRLSTTRINEYKALASPSLIILSSPDPLMTAFQLSWKLRELAISEPETKFEYLKLMKQVEKFAVDLLQQVRSTSELTTILNYDPKVKNDEYSKQLARLQLAINYKQKEFVVHPHVQRILAAIWYEGVPGFKRMNNTRRTWILVKTALLFPLYCLIHLLIPESKAGKLVRRPFMKFLIHASSYLFFLLILILVSQRAENEVVKLFSSDEIISTKQRGVAPSPLEYIILIYVCGFIWEEIQESYIKGFHYYLRDLWNFIDFTRNSLYVATIILRAVAYFQQKAEIQHNSSAAFVPRENWNDFDIQLIAEGLFAAANIFSAFKLIHVFSVNPYLGPLQISLGRMVIDIVKFFFIYTLVLFAFACGLNQLLWYFAEFERKKCYSEISDPNWNVSSDSCIKWRRFSNLFESCQSLFWASFGGVGIESFELSGIKSYTRFWGLLMFGSYSVINVIVLLNLLIAMMSNSYSIIENRADTEWKFARSKLWMNYFEERATLPPPFNLLPRSKLFLKCCGFQKKSKNKINDTYKTRYHKYNAVMKALVWRYVVNTHSENEMKSVTEDDIRELKSDILSWHCELLDIFQRKGMDITGSDTKEKTALGKKMKVWERRLVKDFQIVCPAEDFDDDSQDEILKLQVAPKNEVPTARWKRIARLAILKSAQKRWTQVIDGAVKSSQIGKSNSRVSLQNQESLRYAIKEARRLVAKSPLPPVTPIHLPDAAAASSIMHVLKDDEKSNEFLKPITPPSFISKPMTQSESSTALDYINENHHKSPQPLISQKICQYKIYKKKSQVCSTSKSESTQFLSLNFCNNTSKTNQNSSNSSSIILSPRKIIGKNANDYLNIDTDRPKPRFPSPRCIIPEITIIPTTPDSERKETLRKLFKIEPKSPRYCTRSPRKGWL